MTIVHVNCPHCGGDTLIMIDVECKQHYTCRECSKDFKVETWIEVSKEE